MAKRQKIHKTKHSNPLVGILILLVIALALLGVLLWQMGALEFFFSPPEEEPPVTTTTTTTTTTTAPAPKTMVVTADVLNVRTGPGTEYDVQGSLVQGTEVVALAREGDWYRIQYKETEAYVSADYLVPVGSTTAPTTTTTTESTTTTTAKPSGTTTSPQYNDRYIDSEGMLQYEAGDNYVQVKSYEGDGEIPWALLLVNDWNPMEKGYDEQVKMKKVDRNAVNGNQKVDARMYDDLMKMLDAGKKYNIGVQSSYRPYATQERLYWNQVDRMRGTYSDPVVMQSKAGAIVKRPGYSEHNTGLAVDLYGSGDHTLTESFASTPAYKWLIEHCADYGFVLRFPKDKQAITGVIYEAWHFRYVGDPETAHKIMDNGLCLEEYLEQTKQ